LHRPTAGFLAAAQPSLFPELDYADATLGLVSRREKTNVAVRLMNHDLYWVLQAAAWNQPEVVSTNVAGRYYRKRFNLPVYDTIEVENMPIHTSGGASTGGWLLWANGYVAQDIVASQPGTYLFNVLASGTPALGGWPQMSLKIDGRVQDSITVPTNQAAFYTLCADLTAGAHQLAISFDNDAWAPPEDRNLFLDQIRWGRDSETSPTTLLTAPAAVTQVRLGSGLMILDEINWETETQNAIKAGRYASSLLTGLGAVLRLAPTVAIEAETMSNVNVSAYNVSGGLAHLNSNGRIETAAYFSTAGTYTFEVVAGGNAAQGVLPQIGIVVDGSSRTNFFLTSTNLTRYSVTLFMSAGTHAIGLAFLNDFYAPPEDRNAFFDQLLLSAAPALRIISLDTDRVRQSATVRWEAAGGKSYEVQIASNLLSAAWQPVSLMTNINSSLASWQDTGDLSRPPPLDPSAPQRYYRIRQASP
jgi:hypothetical protein